MRKQVIASASALVLASAVYAGAASASGGAHRYAELPSQSCQVPQIGQMRGQTRSTMELAD
jgi:hypothetical protein